MARKQKQQPKYAISLDPVREDIKEIISKGTENYYRTFTIPKRSGGKRTICAPVFELKRLQKFIFEKLSNNYRCGVWMQGFVKGRNVKTNALHHRVFDDLHEDTSIFNKVSLYIPNGFISPGHSDVNVANYRPKSMVRLDIKNAFGTTSKGMIRRAMPKWFFSPEDLELVLDICTLHGALPQGAPSSPILLNIAMEPFDSYCMALLYKLLVHRFHSKFTYTRYADDITISAPDPKIAFKAIPIVETVAKVVGYEIKKRKTRLMTPYTGLFVNGINIVNNATHISLSRRARANIRAMIYNSAKKTPGCLSSEAIQGKIAYVYSIDHIHGLQLLKYAIKLGALPYGTRIGNTPGDNQYCFQATLKRHKLYTQKTNVSSNNQQKQVQESA